MTKMNFVKSFRLPLLTLKMGGLYVNYPSAFNWKQYIKWSWFFWFNMVALNSDTVGEVVWFVNGARNGKSFVELTFNAPCIIFSVMSSFKMYYLFANKHILTDLFIELEQLYPDTADEGISRIVEESTSSLDPIVKIIFYLNCVLVWLFNLFPLAHIAVKYIETGKVELLLPYLIAYPFNQFDIKIWPIIYARQMWDGIFTTLGTVGPDTFYYACCSHISMHFRILQHQMESCVAWSVDPGSRYKLSFMDQHPAVEAWRSTAMNVDNEELTRSFIRLVRRHRQLIRLVEQLQRLYSVSTLVNFASSSVLICLTGFNVTAIDASQLPVFTVFLISSLSQIFVFCLFGDMIKESSERVSSAIYCSHWYLSHVTVKRMMLFTLTRAQKACKLTALNFAEVNLHSFTRILSTSWSYFALLHSSYNRGK